MNQIAFQPLEGYLTRIPASDETIGCGAEKIPDVTGMPSAVH